MKPLGFRKSGPTFSRVHPSHTEIFNIQSSQWNGPWGRHFYVNCYLVFSDIPFLTPLQRTHRDFRIERIVKDAPWKFEYSEESIASVHDQLGTLLPRASEILTRDLAIHKSDYLRSAEKWKELNQSPTA
jgi:hypothetical protein